MPLSVLNMEGHACRVRYSFGRGERDPPFFFCGGTRLPCPLFSVAASAPLDGLSPDRYASVKRSKTKSESSSRSPSAINRIWICSLRSEIASYPNHKTINCRQSPCHLTEQAFQSGRATNSIPKCFEQDSKCRADARRSQGDGGTRLPCPLFSVAASATLHSLGE
jgi:hypothetical protein